MGDIPNEFPLFYNQESRGTLLATPTILGQSRCLALVEIDGYGTRKERYIMKRQMVWRRGSFFAVVLLALVGISAVHAFESIEGRETIIAADEVIEDDLYVASERIVVEGTIQGDLVAAGQSIVINGTIEGDLIAAARDITVNGDVLDDIRMAGAVLTIGSGASIGDDLVAAGYSLEAQEESGIEGSLIFAGKQAVVASTVAEDMRFAGGGLTLLGGVEGDVEAAVGSPGQEQAWFGPKDFDPDTPPVPEVENGLRMGEDASIGGNLTYHGEKYISTLRSDQVGGDIKHVALPQKVADFDTQPSFFDQLIYHLQRLLLLALVGVLLAWWFPLKLRRLSSQIAQKPLPSLGWGVVVLVGVPLAVIGVLIISGIAAVVLGFQAFGLGLLLVVPVLLVFAVVLIYLAKVVVGYLGGRLLLARFKPELSEGTIWPALLGVVLVGILTILPIVGGLFNLLVMVVGLGAMWLLWREGRTKGASAERLESA